MEGLAWLLMKMAVLLALTGALFFALGWWLRGRQAPADAPPPEHDSEQIRAALHAAESGREALAGELSSARAQLAAAEDEVRRLQSAPPPVVVAETPPAIPADLVLQSPVQKVPKPKAPRKPRAKKTKA